MKRIDQICGLAAIDIGSGARLGEVADVVLDARGRCIAGINIRLGGILKGLRYVDFENIKLFGDVSVLIDAAAAQTNRKKRAERLELGQKVYLTDGSNIGWFTNALIDEADGTVHSLEVSKGILDDLLQGRSWVCEFSCGKEGIIALAQGRN